MDSAILPLKELMNTDAAVYLNVSANTRQKQKKRHLN